MRVDAEYLVYASTAYLSVYRSPFALTVDGTYLVDEVAKSGDYCPKGSLPDRHDPYTAPSPAATALPVVKEHRTHRLVTIPLKAVVRRVDTAVPTWAIVR